jgi:membrane-associated protease RseP (regulator of RpoE activity)
MLVAMDESRPEDGQPLLPDRSQWAGQQTPDIGDVTGRQFDATLSPPLYLRELTAADLHSPRRRRVRLPVLLFLATCLSTFWAGATHWAPYLYLNDLASAKAVVIDNWQPGLAYMAAVIGILLTHEMGHFLQTLRYRVPASLPFFIPVPIVITGTMGAVIGMEGSRANRKQLFDIGLSGPWAGLAVALPVIWFGIKSAHVTPASMALLPAGEPLVFKLQMAILGPRHFMLLGSPLIFKLLATVIRPELPADAVLIMNPLLMAGWVGMLVTGLNMLPVSQLDGGHVIYGLFGRRAHLVARGFIIAAIAYVVIAEQYNWTIMLVLVIMLGVDHPSTCDDSVPLGPLRRIVGLLSLAIPILCFTPVIV